MDKIVEARRVFDIEIAALEKVRDTLNQTFVNILDLIMECKGKVIITGMGKSGHIATKLAATFASLGTPSFYLHPGEAMHGDLGMVSQNDVVIAISYSGESDEVVHILPGIKLIGATLIGITGNKESTLARVSDIVQILPKFDEACYLGFAPTSSTTASLCYGDALAVVASIVHGFKDTDFGKLHPAGALGKKLILKVDDLMAKGEDNATISVEAVLKDAIIELGKKGLGMVSLIDGDGKLVGVITDGDLRRQLQEGVNIYDLHVRDVMTHTPIVVKSGALAIEALNVMKKNNISCVPIVYGPTVIGTLRLQDLIKGGIVG